MEKQQGGEGEDSPDAGDALWSSPPCSDDQSPRDASRARGQSNENINEREARAEIVRVRERWRNREGDEAGCHRKWPFRDGGLRLPPTTDRLAILRARAEIELKNQRERGREKQRRGGGGGHSPSGPWRRSPPSSDGPSSSARDASKAREWGTSVEGGLTCSRSRRRSDEGWRES